MIEQLLAIILDDQPSPNRQTALAKLAPMIKNLSHEEIDSFLQGISSHIERTNKLTAESDEVAPNLTDPQQVILESVVHQFVQREQSLSPDDQARWSRERLNLIEQLYLATSPASDLRNHLLHWLATEGSDPSLRLWTNLICNSPPEHRLGIVLCFAPLMQPSFDPPNWLLTELLENATSHSQIAPPVFDLLNYYFRNEKVNRHIAASRVDSLTDLLGQLVNQLGVIESGKFSPDANAMKLNQQVSDSVSLIVALCDAFALLEHEPAITPLRQALSLRHRRVQTEASAALARLGNEEGKQALIGLAQEPVARLRALSYAEELGFKNEISLELQGEIALAESHLAIWLSEPAQMGLAPSNIDLLDSREMYWPSYEHPVVCFLFKYSYGTGEKVHSNIGICGPVTHAFAADLQVLNYDDVYAAFAGWQTVHQEIFQSDFARAQKIAPAEIGKLESMINETTEGDDAVSTIETAANFFGQWVLIASGSHQNRPATLIVDHRKAQWIPCGNLQAPIDWQLAYSIWKGRELLASFNTERT